MIIYLKLVRSTIGVEINSKLESVLSRNPGYDKTKRICRVLRGENVEINNMNPAEIARKKYAPITSRDVERSFSDYKNIVTEKRQNLTIEHIRFSINGGHELKNLSVVL